MNDSEIIDLEVFNIFRDTIEKYADIKVRYKEIIWLNTNVDPTSKKRVIPTETFVCSSDFNVENINENIKIKFNNRITHKLILPYPHDKENTFTFITDIQLIHFGLKEKPKPITTGLKKHIKLFFG